MANYTKTITHALALADAMVGPFSEPDYVGGDLDFCVGRIRLTIEQIGSRTNDALAGALTTAGISVQTVMAVRGLITVREIEAHGGYLKTTDHMFRISQDDIEFVPKSGDKVTSNGRTYEVIGVDRATWESALRIFCRG